MAKPQRNRKRRQPPKRSKPETQEESLEPKRDWKIVAFVVAVLGTLASVLAIAAAWPDIHIDIPDSSFDPSYGEPAVFSISNNAFLNAYSVSAVFLLSAKASTRLGHLRFSDNIAGPFHVADTLKEGAPRSLPIPFLHAPV